MAILGTNVKVEVQKTLGSALTVSAVTLANPGVATSTAHGLSNGDVVTFTVTAGMVELDKQTVRVASVTTDTFELEGLDTSSYSTWSAGTAKEVTVWSTLSNSQNFSMPNPSPAKIDITTLIDKSKQYAFGLPDAPDGSISGLFNPTLEAVTLIKAATKANTELAFRVTFAAGEKCIFNALVSGGTGFDLQPNQAATSTVSFTPQKDVMFYSS